MVGMGILSNNIKSPSLKFLNYFLWLSNANNVSERYEKSFFGYSLLVHTYNVLSL